MVQDQVDLGTELYIWYESGDTDVEPVATKNVIEFHLSAFSFVFEIEVLIEEILFSAL